MDGGPGGAGYAFAKQVVAHYVNDLARTLAPEQIRVNAIHPTNCNTDMLHSPPMYRAFRPDLQNPTREEAEVVFPMIQGFPIPYVEPEDISALCADHAAWARKALLNVACSGKFSSDRTIAEYAAEIWKARACPV